MTDDERHGETDAGVDSRVPRRSVDRYATPTTTPTMKPELQRDMKPFARRAAYIEKLERKLQEARAEREQAAGMLLAGLGLLVVHPLDNGFQTLDLLSCVSVEDRHWVWSGQFNKKGTPVAYPHVGGHRLYYGASKLVHQAVTGLHHQATYHPRCGVQKCVRPSHRCATCAAIVEAHIGAAS